MIGKQIRGGEDLKISFSILPNETVESLLNDFSRNIIRDIKKAKRSEFASLVRRLADSVKLISPAKIESNELSEISQLVEKITPFFKTETQVTENFFKVLNLCVVGLGSTLKGDTK